MMGLEMFVVYWNPKDYPNQFVVRRWLSGREAPEPKEVCAVGLTLDEVRGKLPPNLYRQPRYLNDDPCIVEVWI